MDNTITTDPPLPEQPPGHSKPFPRLHNGYALPENIAIVYSDVKREYFPTEQQYLTEKDAETDAKIIADYITMLNVKPQLYPGNELLFERLKENKPDLVINLVDSVKGDESLSSTIPAALDLLGIPYTGVGILGSALCYNKFLTKKLLEQNGIPVPHYQLFNTATDILNPTLRFPLISKLNEIHGSVEITKEAVSENEKHLRERLKYLIKTYEQPVLAEEYIVGREVAAILLEGLNKKVYLAEKVFTKPGEKYLFATFEDQWLSGYTGFHYQKYEDKVLNEYVKRAFETTRMDDYGKFDMRIDSSNRYYFIDSNPNPAFGPKEIQCAIAVILDMYGISFLEILKRLIINSVRDALGQQKVSFEQDTHHV